MKILLYFFQPKNVIMRLCDFACFFFFSFELLLYILFKTPNVLQSLKGPRKTQTKYEGLTTKMRKEVFSLQKTYKVRGQD